MAARSRENGFTLLGVGISLIVIVGMMGLAVDLGRMYITKSETQSYADATALAAAVELDGTAEGIARAQAAVSSSSNRWNFNTSPFTGSSIEFATSYPGGTWTTAPIDPINYRFARVGAQVTLPLLLIRAVTPATTSLVRAEAIGAQVEKTRFRHGLFPFSPFAHNTVAPDYGLIPGQMYTLRWASAPKVGNNTCGGDDTQAMIDLAESGGGSERGFIESTSADLIRSTIVDDYQSVAREIGDSVVMTGGAKQTQLSSLIARINQDTDSNAATYADYVRSNTGNGRRLVAAPINTGQPGGYRIVQIGAFFLRPTTHYNAGGNQAFCAEYVGSWVQGSNHKGAGPPGAYVVRLVK